MCFSPEASFVSSFVLSVIGVSAIKKAKTKAQIFFASIPFIFALQQLTEGFVWLSLLHKSFSSWNMLNTYLYLTFAQVVWPSMVPLSILFLEKKQSRKKILYILSVIGIVVSILLTIRLSTENIKSEILEQHINYSFRYRKYFFYFLSVLYISVTIIPPLISSIKRMRLLGFGILISYLITLFYYENYLISVWCFFSAILSCTVYYIVVILNDNLKIEKQESI